MSFGKIVLGQPLFFWPVLLILIFFFVAVIWSYARSPARGVVKSVCTFLKLTAIVALGICLLEPLLYGTHPQKGANVLVLLADNSQSLNISDGQTRTRADKLGETLKENSTWQTRLEQDFDLRRYVFDSKLDAVKDFSKLNFNGRSSNMIGAISTVAERLGRRPMAGMFLFSDGNATDITLDSDFGQLPPIYPVILGEEQSKSDLAISDVAVSMTSFETAPVTLKVQIDQQGIEDEPVVIELLDRAEKTVDQQTLVFAKDESLKQVRFQFRPEKPGISFYKLVTGRKREIEKIKNGTSSEATGINNFRTVIIDRGKGPYRVLYVSGRPNWEFKYLRRAMTEDREVELVGLMRIANKEPKFEFRARDGESNNPLFRGFDNNDEETAEYDQPVIIRFGTTDASELRKGFPKTPEDLFRYHAIILDDVESSFFTRDQMDLLKRFVGHRGGGFLMLGGHASYTAGKYDKTPIEDLLPVYIDERNDPPSSSFRMLLSRDGWLQPWIRLRKTQEEETQRIATMPNFATISTVNRIKPGAEILAFAENEKGEKEYAMVAQSFGNGRCASILVGDFWKWAMHRQVDGERDLEAAWRQTVRWLVANTPSQVDVEVKQSAKTNNEFEVMVAARDSKYQSLDNAEVMVEISDPDANKITISALPTTDEAGVYKATFAAKKTGGYGISATVTADDGSLVGTGEAGWVVDNSIQELKSLKANRSLMSELARKTGGQVVEFENLASFVNNLPKDRIPITETRIFPLWHQWFVFWFAAICLALEWGIRRMQGLP